MTTAAKSTWNAAKGEAAEHGNWSTGGQTSRQFSVLDMPAHTKLKYRQSGQGDREEQKARATSLREEAEAREQEARVAKLQELGKAGDQQAREELRRIEGSMLLLKDKEEITKATQRFDDRDDEADDDDDEGGARGKGNGGGSDSDSDLDSSDSDDEDEDDEELLRLELEKIKREREEARRKQEDEDKAEAAKRKEEEINAAALKGNPLLAGAGGGSAQIKRKWNDDVVFKNQSRGQEEKKKRFINDTVRNDFHKAFLKKYMK